MKLHKKSFILCIFFVLMVYSIYINYYHGCQSNVYFLLMVALNVHATLIIWYLMNQKENSSTGVPMSDEKNDKYEILHDLSTPLAMIEIINQSDVNVNSEQTKKTLDIVAKKIRNIIAKHKSH